MMLISSAEKLHFCFFLIFLFFYNQPFHLSLSPHNAIPCIQTSGLTVHFEWRIWLHSTSFSLSAVHVQCIQKALKNYMAWVEAKLNLSWNTKKIFISCLNVIRKIAKIFHSKDESGFLIFWALLCLTYMYMTCTTHIENIQEEVLFFFEDETRQKWWPHDDFFQLEFAFFLIKNIFYPKTWSHFYLKRSR